MQLLIPPVPPVPPLHTPERQVQNWPLHVYWPVQENKPPVHGKFCALVPEGILSAQAVMQFVPVPVPVPPVLQPEAQKQVMVLQLYWPVQENTPPPVQATFPLVPL